MYHLYEDDYKLLNEDNFELNEENSQKSCQSFANNDSERVLKKGIFGIFEPNVRHYDFSVNGTNGVSKLKQSKKGSSQYDNDSIVEKRVGKWTEEEDNILRELVPLFGGKNWRKISEYVKGRSPIQCLHRWSKILQPGLVKGPWTVEEDKKLIEWVKKEGPTRWSQCAELVRGRNGKQCRERWFNSLNPKVKKGDWTAEEDFLIFFYYKKLGGRWSKISIYFEGRTENSLKNRFYSTLRRISTESMKFELKNFDVNDEIITHKENTNLNGTDGKEGLFKYFEIADSLCRNNFKKKRNFNDEQLEQYEKTLIETIKNTKYDKSKKFNYEEDKIKVNEPINRESIALNNTKHNTINVNVNINNNSNNNFIFNDMNINSLLDNNLLNSNPNKGQSKPENQNDAANNYKNLDIFSLEKDISSMCDNSLFFSESNFYSLDNHLDNLIESMFANNNIVITNDPTKDCDICLGNCKSNSSCNMNFNYEKKNLINSKIEDKFKIPMANNKNSQNNDSNLNSKGEETKIKNEVYQNLLSKLNGLEKLVKDAKKELNKYEQSDEYLLGNYSLDNLFKL